ncbi:MAG: hypothetical protein NPIRA03_14060 [Nitrospirales bacterium]|nr:MAG: hypothetical protein NPIRA03_14060 [Nitrospirales bacterium]
MRLLILLFILMGPLPGFDHLWMTEAKAQSGPASQMATTEPPSVSSDETIKADPVCDPSRRPKITKIEPDEFQAGAKVVIIGENFGQKKECLHTVTFGYENAKEFTLKGNERIEATAPDNLSPGMVFVNVETGGGSVRSAVLIKK